METNKKCKKCKTIMEWVGFSRKLITRGKDKGKSIVEEFYHCPACNSKTK